MNGAPTRKGTNGSPTLPEEERAARADESGHSGPSDLPAFWIDQLGNLSDAPPKRRWFMHDLRSRKKMLRAGKCVVVSADGGVGKSILELMMAVSVALGRPLFDVFQPDHAGHVALLMGEDDAEECMDRLHRICNAMHLGRDERDVVAKRILLFPLAGKQVSLLEVDQYKNAQWSDTLATIIRQLTERAREGGFEWTLVGLDPLARFAGGNAESDNERATLFVEALESLALRVPGNPAILCSHHTSKVGLRNGKSDTRGVTGIRNAFRAEFVMERVEAEGLRGVVIDNRKNNYAPHAEPIWLVQMSDEPMGDGIYLQTGGVLRRATEEESETLATACGAARGDPESRRAERETKRNAAKIASDQGRRTALLACLPLEPSHVTTAQVEEAMAGARLARRAKGTPAELRELSELGLAIDLSLGKGKTRKWCRCPRRQEA